MILTCLTTVLLNVSNIPYNKQDYKALARSVEVCSQRQACLGSFEKREQGIYRAYCKEKEEFSRKEFDKAELNMLLLEMDRLGDSLERKKQKLRSLGYEVKE